MENKLKSVLSGAGFYVLLGVCLVLAAVSVFCVAMPLITKKRKAGKPA